MGKGKVINYFVIMNSAIQCLTSAKLIEDFHLKDGINILFYRKPFFSSNLPNAYANAVKWDDIHIIPFFDSKLKLLLWCNFLIYILYFTIIFLKTRRKAYLVIGNYTHFGNRAICNLLNKYWLRIFVIDEGLSTAKVVDDRSQLIKHNSRLSTFNRIFKTGHPDRELTFYTNFKIESNGKDLIFRAENVLPRSNEIHREQSSTVYFIGSSLVESGIITREYFCKLINRVREVNEGREIIYIAHPREDYIFTLFPQDKIEFKILKIYGGLEKYLLDLNYIPAVISSCISTGYIHSSTLFRNSVKYQTFILDVKQMLRQQQEMELVYNLLHNQMIEFNVEEYNV